MSTIATAVTAFPTRSGYMYHDEGSGWPWLWGLLTMVILLALVAVAVWFLVRHTSAAPTAPDAVAGTPESTPEQVLAHRYARGEIESDEYRERLATLREVVGGTGRKEPGT
jgi:putative membrane protein